MASSAGRVAQQQESSGSSAFTEEEILNELRELGVQLTPAQIAELKDELDQLLTSGSSQSHQAPELDTRNTLSALTDMPVESLSGDQLLSAVESACDRMQQQCDRIDALIRGSGGDKTAATQSDGVALSQAAATATTATEQIALDDLREELRKHGKENALVTDEELRQLYAAYEKGAKSDEPLDQPTVRAIVAPVAGTGATGPKSTLPFRHDPVRRHALYEQFWRRNPAPGEQKRMKLRWKVREYMLRKDVPVWKG